MRKLVIRTTACCVLSTCMIAGYTMIGNAKNAATILPTGGFANVLSEYCSTDSKLPAAGVTVTLDEYAVTKADADIVESVSKVSEEYRHLVIAQIDPYVTVRAEARDDAEALGKLYNNAAATLLGESGEFYLVSSGSVQGYVRKDCVVRGEQAEAVGRQVGKRLAAILADTVNIYAAKDTNSLVLFTAGSEETLTVTGEEEGWIKVSYIGTEGYVPAEALSLYTKFAQAESKEEEAARIAAEEAAAKAAEEARKAAEAAKAEEAEAAARAAEEAAQAAREAAERVEAEEAAEAARKAAEAAEEAAQAAEEQRESRSGSSGSESSSSKSEESYSKPSSASSSSKGQQIADYALQFVGNPYVWGGTSLTNGADCSGFVMSVFSDCGISVAGRTASAQSTGGTSISSSELQPGDLVFYASGGSVSHVAIYIGDGQIVHAANSRKGIIVSSYNYQTPYKYVRY